MTLWLDLARLAAVGNAALLLALAWVWVPRYRQHGARHTLMLLVFAGFLLLENVLWLALYVLHDGFVGWFLDAGTDVQLGMLALCGLEFVALAFMASVTWR